VGTEGQGIHLAQNGRPNPMQGNPFLNVQQNQGLPNQQQQMQGYPNQFQQQQRGNPMQQGFPNQQRGNPGQQQVNPPTANPPVGPNDQTLPYGQGYPNQQGGGIPQQRRNAPFQQGNQQNQAPQQVAPIESGNGQVFLIVRDKNMSKMPWEKGEVTLRSTNGNRTVMFPKNPNAYIELKKIMTPEQIEEAGMKIKSLGGITLGKIPSAEAIRKYTEDQDR
jgi:hypothetical protein